MQDAVLTYQTLSRGEIDPRLVGQYDHEAYAKGLDKLRNAVPIVQGGFRRRPGHEYIATLPNQITPLSLLTAAVTAPNNGTPANATDGDDSTELESDVAIGTTNNYVLLTVDVGVDRTVLFADVEDLRHTGTATSTREWRVQYATSAAPSTWTTMGTAIYKLTSEKLTRRFTGPVTARHFRIVRVGSTDLGSAVAIVKNFKLWIASATLSEHRLIPMEFSEDQRYLLAVGDRNIRVFKDDVFQVDVPSPLTSSQIAEMDHARSLDTTLLFHVEQQTHSVVRKVDSSIGAVHDAWDSRAWAYVNVPKAAFGRVTTNEGKASANIGYNVPFAAGVELALLTITTGAGSRQITVTSGTTDKIRVGQLMSIQTSPTDQILEVLSVDSSTTFTVDKVPDTIGAGLSLYGGDFTSADVGKYIKFPIGFAKIKTYLNPGAVAIDYKEFALDALPMQPRVWSIVEDAFSATRGWPGCGDFYENSLWVARTPDLPQTAFRSKVGDPKDFDDSRSDDDFGFQRTANTQDVPLIAKVVASDRLQLLTTNGVFYLPAADGSGVLTPTNTAVKKVEEVGAKIGIPIAKADGLTVFIEDSGASVRAMGYNAESVENYQIESLSRLSAHLISAPVGLAYRRSRSDDEASYLYVVNDDGSMAVQCLVPKEGTAAWCLWTTSGSYKDVAALDADVYVVARRTVGSSVDFLEKLDDSRLYDASVAGTGASATISGLGHLEGKSVGVTIDGAFQSDKTVSGGAVTPDCAGTSTYEAGLRFPVVDGGTARVWMRTLAPAAGAAARMKRLLKAWFEFEATKGCHIGVSSDEGSFARADEVTFHDLDGGVVLLAPTSYTGRREVPLEPLWSRKPHLDVKQPEDWPLTVRAFDVEMRVA